MPDIFGELFRWNKFGYTKSDFFLKRERLFIIILNIILHNIKHIYWHFKHNIIIIF